MKFAELVKPTAVKVLQATTSKKRLLHDAADLAAGCYGLNAETAFDALMERESLGPTGVGLGIALPHARLPGLDSVVGAFVLLEKPVDFDAVDRQPVDLCFALFAPEDAGVSHLKALALVSRSLRNAALCAKLRANPDVGKLYTILTETETDRAA